MVDRAPPMAPMPRRFALERGGHPAEPYLIASSKRQDDRHVLKPPGSVKPDER
jgi:hypothetical protein